MHSHHEVIQSQYYWAAGIFIVSLIVLMLAAWFYANMPDGDK